MKRLLEIILLVALFLLGYRFGRRSAKGRDGVTLRLKSLPLGKYKDRYYTCKEYERLSSII